jgi:transposase
MNQFITFPEIAQRNISVGLDVHKNTIRLAALSGQEWLLERTFSTSNLGDLRKALRRLSKLGEVRACYEASGAGFRLQRLLTEWGVSCQVIAPSLIPKKPGEKKKCDRLDARMLAEYFDRNLLTNIHIPTAEEEADRNLVRCRFAFRKEVVRGKHRVVKFLDCQGRHYPETAWTVKHRQWLKKQEFASKSDQLVFESYLEHLSLTEARLREVDGHIKDLSEQDQYRDGVRILCAFRGVSVLTAMVFLTEIGDLNRFPSPRKLMAYLGLVPKVHQSGESSRRAGITKAGNARLRHVMVQAAWKYISPRFSHTAKREKERSELPVWVLEQSLQAQKRLHKRFSHLSSTRGKCIAIP